ncbi:MAG: EscU/YscU/HrcU family type III secretion system export apparatus switch protein [Desulfobacterales bacterium]
MTDPSPKDSAVALKYQPKSDHAPKIIAKGKGKLAQRIIQIAQEHDIYVHQDPDLIEVLSQLDLNEEIPPELYVIVAELLGFIYSLNREETSP